MTPPRPLNTTRARTLRASNTPAEKRLWSKLRNRGLAGHKFVRQFPIGPYFGDFVCREAMLVVEIDGETHHTPEQMAHDRARTDFIHWHDYQIIRFWNTEVYNELEGVLITISEAVSSQRAKPKK